MIERKVVESIVETYDLSDKKKKQLVGMAMEIPKYIETFEDVCNRVAYIMDTFYRKDHLERDFTRLDHPRKGSNRVFHELISTPSYLEEDKEGKEYRQRDLKEKLKKLASEQKEPLTILGRPVRQIEPVIRLGNRRYNGNPIVIFRKEEFFEGKSRKEVHTLDQAMYKSLQKHNQLHIAIPKIKDTRFKRISKEKESEIIEAWEILKSATKIAKKLNISRTTVYEYRPKPRYRI